MYVTKLFDHPNCINPFLNTDKKTNMKQKERIKDGVIRDLYQV